MEKLSLVWLNVLIFIYNFYYVSSEDISSFPTREERIRTGLFSSIQGFARLQIFKTLQVDSQITCVSTCLEEIKCQSVNYKIDGYPKHLCELSDRRFISKDELDIRERPGYIHIYAIKEYVDPHPCGKATCKNGGTCVLEDNARQYRCICNAFNKDSDCNLWKVNIKSCADIYTLTSHRKNIPYTFTIGGKEVDIYCHLTDDVCGGGGGGWTLAMKIDGTKNTFTYASVLWYNKKEYELSAGKTGFDNHETKMPSYWAMPFQSLCVGMEVGNNLNWALIPYPAPSLYDIFSDKTYRNFSIGREKWLSLIGGSSLHTSCNTEGFSVKRARIGIQGDVESDCVTSDSWIGFGLPYASGNTSCGNFCERQCSAGYKPTAAFGYILIK